MNTFLRFVDSNVNTYRGHVFANVRDMETHERLKIARERAGFSSARAAAEALSLSTSTYSAHENGSRGIKRKEIERYARRFRVTANWLMFGEDAEPIERIENTELIPDGKSLVPVYDVAASAGDGAVVDYEGIAYSLAFPPDYLRRITTSNPSNLTIISVKGDSMAPTLNDDDIVMLDMSKRSLGYEGLFVIRIFEVLHVKRLSHARPGHVMVISDNSNKYPAREYAAEDVEVVGKVLWSGGKV